MNRFRLGKADFELVYENFDSDEVFHRYTELRNDLYKVSGLQAPHSCIDSVPRKGYHIIDSSLVLHRSLGYGTFGFLWAEVHASQSTPVAVKELTVKSKGHAEKDNVENELVVATSFPVSEQIKIILRTLTCCRAYVVYFKPLKYTVNMNVYNAVTKRLNYASCIPTDYIQPFL